MSRRSALALALLLALAPGAARAQAPPSLLRVDGRRVTAENGVPLVLVVPDGPAWLGVTRFRESYGGPDFDVTATAFADDSVLIAVHAEVHADGSGGLDYSNLAPDSLAGIPFTSDVGCFDLREETDEDVAGNGFLRFLRSKGFSFDRAVVLKRYFTTNEAGSAEVVLSYGRIVGGCGADGAPPPGAAERVAAGSRRAFADLTRG